MSGQIAQHRPDRVDRSSGRVRRAAAARAGLARRRDPAASRRPARGLSAATPLLARDRLGREPILNQLGHDRAGRPRGSPCRRCCTRTNRRPMAYVSGDRRYTITIGRPCSAACTVAVPDAVTTTSDAASTSSVAASRRSPRGSRRRAQSSSGANSASSSAGARATRNCTPGTLRATSDAAAPPALGRIRANLVRPAARQQRHDGPARVEADRRAATSRVSGRPRQVDQRMADELDRHAGLLVDRRLERKDHEHRDRRTGCSVSSRPGRHAQSCGLT